MDMRWGVRDEMTDEHMTKALCMNELRGCQKYSMGPNFIYFGAQKLSVSNVSVYLIAFVLGTDTDPFHPRLIRQNLVL